MENRTIEEPPPKFYTSCHEDRLIGICGNVHPFQNTIIDKPENISVVWRKEKLDLIEEEIYPVLSMRKVNTSEWKMTIVTRFDEADMIEYFSLFTGAEFNQKYEFRVYLPSENKYYYDSDCWCRIRVHKPDPVKNLRYYHINESHFELYWDPGKTYDVPFSHYTVWASSIDKDTFNNTQRTKTNHIVYSITDYNYNRVRVAAVTKYSSYPKDIIINPYRASIEDNVTEPVSPIVVGVLGGLIGLMLICFLVFLVMCVKKRRSKCNTKAQLMMTVSGCSSNCPLELYPLSESVWNREMNSLYGGGFVSPPPDPFDDDDSFENVPKIPETNIRFLRYLGSGAFGKVWEGWVKIVVSPEERYYKRVALKVRNPTALSEEDFKREALLMFKYKHPNLVQLIGVSFDRVNNQLQCLLLEMMEQGNLRQYLHEARPKISAAHMRRAIRHGQRFSHPTNPTESLGSASPHVPHSAGAMQIFEAALDLPNLMTILRDITNGCKYLEEKRYVHRDIAARNCLVSHRHPTGRIVKISDFGLARDIYRNDYYRKQNEPKLPVRWMSPEAIQDGNFSVKSDVWSFAVTCWEVMTMGMDPFYGHRNREVINKILGGYVLEKPDNCPHKLYDQLLLCWSRFPEMRPSFSDLAAKMDEFCELSKDKDSPFSKPFLRKLPTEALPRSPPSYDNSNSVLTEQTVVSNTQTSAHSQSNNNQTQHQNNDLMTTSLEFDKLPRLPGNIISSPMANSPSASINTLPRRKESSSGAQSNVTKESILMGNDRFGVPHYLNVMNPQDQMSISIVSSPSSFLPNVELRNKEELSKEKTRVISH